ncbi:OsmC family protein [Ancylobacter oerskovii]|uniref:OsmC family protein n=1 Tax=Ancylobacter oerskovii TaxID=459519 RepID=A0ABW4YU68_9HYPH|nr:OsmC family protein [Ancylobacter oerskovii]MBS7543728.1 OsmC family protein [Ancylobacter oerskovii]
MATMTVELRSVPDTRAAMGWAGGHTVTVDRAEGVAGGNGLGFNGGQLLGLAIGGCLCNDLHYAAAQLGIEVTEAAVSVEIDFEGTPLLATAARVKARIAVQPEDADAGLVLRRAWEMSTVSNSLRRGVPVELAGG